MFSENWEMLTGGRGLWEDEDDYGVRLGGSECSGCVGWVWWVWARTSKCTDDSENKSEVKRDAEMHVSYRRGLWHCSGFDSRCDTSEVRLTNPDPPWLLL